MDVYTRIINTVSEFPTLPTIFSTLNDVIANTRSTANDVASVISQDQSAASKILKSANSSIYGFRGRITTVTQAIMYLGFEEVRNLVIALSIIDMFSNSKTSVNLNPVHLWKHSIAVGTITRLIGQTIGIKNLESYFLAGILHDIGKLLFFRFFPDDYIKVLNYAIESGVTEKDAESEILGITHTVAGEMLAERWKLPSSIKEGIKYHTTGLVNGKVNLLAGSIHIADITASMLKLGISGDHIVPEPTFEVWDALALPDHFFTLFLNKILMDYRESVTLLLKK